MMLSPNYGDGPGLFSVNLRLSRTVGFGGGGGGSAAGGRGGRYAGGRRTGGGGHAGGRGWRRGSTRWGWRTARRTVRRCGDEQALQRHHRNFGAQSVRSEERRVG